MFTSIVCLWKFDVNCYPNNVSVKIKSLLNYMTIYPIRKGLQCVCLDHKSIDSTVFCREQQTTGLPERISLRDFPWIIRISRKMIL